MCYNTPAFEDAIILNKEKNTMKKNISSILCLVMILAMCFGMVACSSKTEAPAATEATVAEDGVVVLEDGKTYGEGATAFTFAVTDLDGNTVTVTVKTDEETVGAALVALNMVSGSTSEYGLMVDTVNGITLDYNKDGKYWAFYINGEYASTGVDSTPVDADATYSFVAE